MRILRFTMGTGRGVKKRRVKACKPWQEAISRIRYGQNSWEYGLAEQMRMTVGVGTTHPASQSCRAVLHSRLMLRARFREARQRGAGGENVRDFSGKNGLHFPGSPVGRVLPMYSGSGSLIPHRPAGRALRSSLSNIWKKSMSPKALSVILGMKSLFSVIQDVRRRHQQKIALRKQ